MHTDAPTPSSPSCPPATPGVLRYQRHRPEDSVLYALVEQHRPAFQRSLAERERPLPGFVLDEFRRYLACGRLEHSFIRVKCDGCRHELLVAFSCKNRGEPWVLPIRPGGGFRGDHDPNATLLLAG